jgi:hypothetical protein
VAFLLCVFAAACWTSRDPAGSYVLEVRGAVTVAARGPVESGVTGAPPDPYYNITLGGPAGAAAAVFTRVGSTPPPVGVYPVGESALGREGFSGLVITGMPAHPTGIFRIQGGTLAITSRTADQLSGKFELRAVGFFTETPSDDHQVVTATGAFTALLPPEPPALSGNHPPHP